MISASGSRGRDPRALLSGAMLSRKALIVLAFTTISLFTILITSKRLGGWSSFTVPYYPSDSTHKSNHASTSSSPSGRPGPDVSMDPMCEGFPDTSNILLVMKTGASESFARLPTQFMTILRCLPDFLIFSDLDQVIAGHQVYDSLSTVLTEVMDGNSDFDLYRRQRTCQVDQNSCNKLGDPASEGWNLDKYKNIHMMEKAYTMRPGYDWYLFVDADSYVIWPNMVDWLKTLNPKKKLYLGSVTLINGFSFGHGGSGYVVSQAAVKDFVGGNPGIGNQYDERVRKECCGDYVFGMAIKEKSGIAVTQVWPTINGEKPTELPWGPSHWCHPIVTMHHLSSEEVNAFWQFERKRRAALERSGQSVPPLLIKDIYEEYFGPKLQAKREDWDNRSDNRLYFDKNDTSHRWEDWQLDRLKNIEDMNEFEKNAHKSFDACGKACKSVSSDECFQWLFRDGVCAFNSAFTFGHPVKREDSEAKRYMSGWDVEKIQKWIVDQGQCEINWPYIG